MFEEDEVEFQADPPAPSFWQRLRGSFSRNARWHDLNWAVATYPNVAANYVLRGELLLKQGDTVGAISDFRRALKLAAQQVDTEDWGFVAQSLQDRALAGLRDALYRAARYNLHVSSGDN